MSLFCRRLFLLFVAVSAFPRSGWAQSQGTIAGTVRDNTGAVMPGVTVEASSPALIEKLRTAVTDGTGQYKITELDPGLYSVTFTLAGFTTVKREGIQLTSGFTANVSPDLAVGSVAETITVSGAAPIVDVQNPVEQRVLTRDIIDSIPTGKLAADMAVLIPGMAVSSLSRPSAQDVGGQVGSTAQALAIHGGRSTDQEPQVEGMSIGVFSGMRLDGNTSYITPANSSIQETNIEYAAKAAQLMTGGVRVNIILKSGGNTFNGSGSINTTRRGLQSNNYTAALQAQGLPAPQPIDWLEAGDVGLGGPIRKDKLWFFGSYLNRNDRNYVSRYFDSNESDYVYSPDLSRQVVDTFYQDAVSTKLTWQATPKNKFTYYYDWDRDCQCTYRILADNLAPEAVQLTVYPNTVNQSTWTAPLTNRLLLEAGFSWVHRPGTRNPSPGAVGPAVVDQATGLGFRAASSYSDTLTDNGGFRGSASYVTGAHSIKIGTTYDFRRIKSSSKLPLAADGAPVDYSFRIVNSQTGVPNQVTFVGAPQINDPQTRRWGAFAQDQWTVRRLTVNGGVRFDWMGGQYPALRITPNSFFSETDFPAKSGVLSMKNVNPRMGVVYDVFGNGKTALKASLGRYNLAVGPSITLTPLNFVATSLTRTWNDATPCAGCISGDYIPQGNPLNPAANGELGPSPNNTFGTPVVTSFYDPQYANGWQTLDYDWEASVGLSHQLRPGVAMEVAYFRRWYGNFPLTDNTLTATSDYSPYCVTAPLDARLPGGGGQRICGYDLNPNKVGQVYNEIGNASMVGNQYEHWNGFDVGVNVRPREGMLLQGGVSTGKTMTDNCDVVAKEGNPSPLYCHTETPFLTQLKLLGSVRLPWTVDFAATYQSLPGIPLTANWTVTNAQIAPSLNRNLSAGATSTVTLNLIAPGTAYADRLNQLDLRLARTFPFQRTRRIKAIADLYNSLNSSAVTVFNTTYGTNGSAWAPQQILPGRLLKFEAQVTF